MSWAHKPQIELTARQLREARAEGDVTLELEYVAFKQSALQRNDKHVRFEDPRAFAASGHGRPFCYRHGDRTLGLISSSLFIATSDGNGPAQYIHQKAMLVDHGDTLDRAVDGQLCFVSIAIEASSTKCVVCRADVDLKGETCELGHRLGFMYGTPAGPRLCEALWPLDTKLRETSWVDEPSCDAAAVLAIRHRVTPRKQSAARLSAPAPRWQHSQGSRPPPTAQEREALLAVAFGDRRFTTSRG